MRRTLLAFLAASLLVLPAAGAETISGRVIGLDLIRKAIYISHENSGETRGDNKFVWDENVPGRQRLESSSIGDEIRLEAERRGDDWKVTSVPGPAKAEAPFDPQFSTIPPSAVSAPVAAATETPLPPPPPPQVALPPAAPPAPPLRQFSVEEAPLPAPRPPAPAPASIVRTSMPPAARTNIRPNNDRPAPAAPRPAEPSGDRPAGRNPVLGFLTDSVNGAARSVDGAFDRILRRHS